MQENLNLTTFLDNCSKYRVRFALPHESKYFNGVEFIEEAISFVGECGILHGDNDVFI